MKENILFNLTVDLLIVIIENVINKVRKQVDT